jgi:hypothetical protein
MPRVTKADLEAANAKLQKENEELKKRLSRGHDRSRSPRMPASNSQAHVDTTCRALNQVRLWQHDTVLQEHREEIQRLREEAAAREAVIDSLRRGEGPVGPVLVHMHRMSNARIGYVPQDSTAEDLYMRRTMPVWHYFDTVGRVLREAADVMSVGVAMTHTRMPSLI